MNKVYLTNDIFYIENFLSEKSHNNFIKMCEENEKKFQYTESFFLQRGKLYMSNNLSEDQEESWAEIDFKLKSIFNNDKHYLSGTRLIIKFNEYDKGFDKVFSFGEHYDDYGSRTENNLDDFLEPVIFFGCVYYINDSYDGGFVMYPKSNVYIKPKANTLVCHSGYEPHMVTQIFNGKKYNVPAFIKNKKINLN
jgi:hypothetical protein